MQTRRTIVAAILPLLVLPFLPAVQAADSHAPMLRGSLRGGDIRLTRLVPHEILAPHRTPKVRYRAQDTRLGCGVALKNLLAARHQHFEQEGRAVPALSRLNRLRVDPFRCDVLQRRCR